MGTDDRNSDLMRIRLWPFLALFLLPVLAWADGAQLDHDMRRHEQGRDLDAMEARVDRASGIELESPEGYFWRVRMALLAGQSDQAGQLLEEGLAAHPQSSRLVLQRSSLLSESFGEVGTMGRVRLAREVRDGMARAVELDPDSIQARLGLALFYLNAPRLVGGGADRAEPHLEILRERAPMDYFELNASLAMGRGEMESALDWLRQATDADPERRPRFREALALIALQRHEEARSVLTAILERFPNHAAAWYQLGRSSVLAQDHIDEGVAALQRYLETRPWPSDPSPAAAWWRIGQLHQLDGDVELARQAFKESLARDRQFSRAAEALDQLDGKAG